MVSSESLSDVWEGVVQDLTYNYNEWCPDSVMLGRALVNPPGSLLCCYIAQTAGEFKGQFPPKCTFIIFFLSISCRVLEMSATEASLLTSKVAFLTGKIMHKKNDIVV